MKGIVPMLEAQHVRDLMVRYAYAIDKRDFAQLERYFTIDVDATYPGYSGRGRESLISYIAASLRSYSSAVRHMHLISNVICKPSDDIVNSETYCLVIRATTPSEDTTRQSLSTALSGVRYLDTVTADGDVYAIKSRQVIVDWRTNLTAAGEKQGS